MALKYTTADVTENMTQDAMCRQSQNANRIFSCIGMYWNVLENIQQCTCMSLFKPSYSEEMTNDNAAITSGKDIIATTDVCVVRRDKDPWLTGRINGSKPFQVPQICSLGSNVRG